MRRELGGEPGGAWTSVKVVVANEGSSGPGAFVVVRSSDGITGCDALDATSCLPPGRVPLQQSSAFDDGTHLPFLQQAAAFCVNFPLLKQSNGFSSKSTAITLTKM